MVNVGVLGLGMMGLTHLDVYAKRSDVCVIAISDKMADRLEGKTRAAGNVPGMAKGAFDISTVRKYPEGMDLIRDKDVQLIDICLPTPMHMEYALAAMAAGKHVLVEKPLARTYADAQRLAEAADKASGLSMIAMCMRFWPGWSWLKEAVAEKTYGRVLAAGFRRVAPHPGGDFYRNGALSGGAALDLHIHDTDFVRWIFGTPKAVSSVGYSKVTTEPDHITTRYHYDDVPMVSAEGCWCMTDGFPFNMSYTINFEQATAVFDLAAKDQLMLYESGQAPRPMALDSEMGYAHEIAYFLECIKENRRPIRVTLGDGAEAIRIVEAEVRSARSGGVVNL
jgi:predicted dehydrogenase